MFPSAHRADLKEAHEREVAALKLLVEMLAEQVDYLRAIIAQRPYVNPRAAQPANPSQLQPAVPGEPAYLTEEEEEILALREFDHLDDADVERLRATLGLPNLSVSSD